MLDLTTLDLTKTPRAISVTLPKSKSFDDFECALQKALGTESLNHWLATSEGLAHLERLRIDPHAAHRFTNYGEGACFAPTVAQEIHIARPRMDGDRLVLALERTFLKYLNSIK